MTTKRKIVRTVGTIPAFITYKELRLDREGFLSIWSMQTSDAPYRTDLMIRRDAAVALPVDFARRVVYLVGQLRHAKHFAAGKPGQRGPFIVPGLRVTAGTRDAKRPEMHKRAVEGCTVYVPSAPMLSIESPAGEIDEGETPEEAALREVQQETGFVAKARALDPVGVSFPSVGGSTERLHLFIVDVRRSQLGQPAGDGHEQIIVIRASFEEAWRMAATGEIDSTSTLLLLAELRLRDIERTAASGRRKRGAALRKRGKP
ncbi:MAG: hypothetical protein RLZZ324_10 [Candidatus Parcubacteria bacterium]|jgi:8-oxo-dGTP pyrophosphatase MutT (NUDIX family)